MVALTCCCPVQKHAAMMAHGPIAPRSCRPDLLHTEVAWFPPATNFIAAQPHLLSTERSNSPTMQLEPVTWIRGTLGASVPTIMKGYAIEV
jgi:hypothetical protein